MCETIIITGMYPAVKKNQKNKQKINDWENQYMHHLLELVPQKIF